jgi:excisionase family DNA binding protein
VIFANAKAWRSLPPKLAARAKLGSSEIRLLSFRESFVALIAAMKTSAASPIGSQLLTDKSVAEKINVSMRTVIDWRNAGKIPFIRIGRSIRYRPESIRALLEKLEIGGAN